MRVSINDEWKFSTEGYFIFKKNGTQLDPNNGEGKILSDIIKIQEKADHEDISHREEFLKRTHPNDTVKQEEFRKRMKIDRKS